jgi:hypothetical protein
LSADPKHRNEILEAFGLTEESRGITVPVEDVVFDQDLEESVPLEAGKTKKSRSLAARFNYLGQDRPDLQFGVKEMCQKMANPTEDSMKRLKRLARYILEVPTGVIRFDANVDKLDKLMTYVDSDWAGCKTTRKSTSAGVMTWGKSVLKSWSRTQGSVSLSSGEAEFYAAIKGSAESIGCQSLLRDMGIDVKLEIITDSSAAKGTASRIGIGKVKHLDVGWLWIQESVKMGQICVRKINGKVNPADVLTKPKSAAEAVRLFYAVGYGLVIRNPRGGQEEDFVGFVRRIMKGSVDSHRDQLDTETWWTDVMRPRWYGTSM